MHVLPSWIHQRLLIDYIPHGLLMLWKCFLDFAAEHWFGCRTTEPGFTGDSGAIEVWLIDWLIDYCQDILLRVDHPEPQFSVFYQMKGAIRSVMIAGRIMGWFYIALLGSHIEHWNLPEVWVCLRYKPAPKSPWPVYTAYQQQYCIDQ